MKTDRIFVLLLVVMLPMSGCFDDAVGDAEGADDATSGTTVINNYYNNTTQQPTYYSSGGIEFHSWDEHGVNAYGNLNETHSDYTIQGSHFTDSDEYNTSECLSKGGFEDGERTTDNSQQFRLRPLCSINLVTINTSAGQALVIHELSNSAISSVCNGVDITSSSSASDGYILSGSALDCTHRLYYSMTYSTSEEMMVWSVLYSIQATIVV